MEGVPGANEGSDITVVRSVSFGIFLVFFAPVNIFIIYFIVLREDAARSEGDEAGGQT